MYWQLGEMCKYTTVCLPDGVHFDQYNLRKRDMMSLGKTISGISLNAVVKNSRGAFSVVVRTPLQQSCMMNTP